MPPGSRRATAAACAPVYRAEAAGLIVIDRVRPNFYRCFANERDRTRWHLVRELLRPGIPAARVAEIRAEVAVLDAERSATWVTSLRSVLGPMFWSGHRLSLVSNTQASLAHVLVPSCHPGTC